MPDILDLQGRNALVTGAGQGVGRQIVMHFADHNAGGIVINDYYQERANTVAKELKEAGVKCRLIPIGADVTKHDDVQRMVDTARAQLDGPIHILVNNAGNSGSAGLGQSRFVETSPDFWEPWIRVNLYGVLNCSHAVLPGMINANYGKIVTVISDAARVPERQLAVYGAAKAGAAAFMRCLAGEVGRHNITCNCVALGTTRTPTSESVWQDEKVFGAVLKLYLLPRLGEPTDAANMILFLSSDASSWITGQTYPVNGGYSVTL